MSEHEPNVWCLLGRKAGDNTQVRALAEALGWSFTEKHICAHAWELLPHLLLRVTLAGIDRGASSQLAAPWPDLVISAGRRNEPVARWIKRQSGGRTRLVHIGRPWAALRHWDMIVTTPQYFLPAQANVRHNRLPLQRVDRDARRAEGERWRELLVHLPRPWIAVLVGGDSGKFVLTRDKGERLGSLARRLADSGGGSLLVTGSPRTPDAVMDALESTLAAPYYLYRWGDGGDNPYQGLLALADAFVVTGESMSMLAEAAATGKPLYIFDMGDSGPWWRYRHGFRHKPLSHHLAMVLGPERMRRDVGRIQDALVAAGNASWLSEDSRLKLSAREGAERLARDELKASAAAVRRLLELR